MAIKNTFVTVLFRTSPAMRDRLRHHAQRVGVDMNDIVREGTIKYLEELDEKEERLIAKKSSRKAPGLGIKRDVPQKFVKSFRRWSEFIEEAKDEKESKSRVEDVVQDIRDRSKNEEEIKTVYNLFQEFLEARADAKGRSEGGEVDMSKIGKISGDVE